MSESAAGPHYLVPDRPAGEHSESAAGRRAACGHGRSRPSARQAEDFETVLSHITHDLRAAARPVSIVPDWIREDMAREREILPERIEEHLRTLERHAARLSRMLLDLRTYSRIGRVCDPPARLDLGVELDSVLGELALPPGFEVARRIGTTTVTAPRSEFWLVLHAVIGNGWKHHDRERGRITVAATQGSGAVRVAVIDDGPGIERRYRDTVFGMMTTLRPRDEVEGSGLGLSIARKVVTRLGGTIEITEPLAPRGTCVVIVLPQAPPPANDETPEGAPEGAPAWSDFEQSGSALRLGNRGGSKG